MHGIERSSVLDALKAIDWRGIGVSLAIVYGSALRSTNPRDIDMVVVPKSGIDPEDLAVKIMEIVERVLGLEVDLYLLVDPSDTNCFLLLEALSRGTIVYQDLYGREILVKAIDICNDFMLSRRFVRYTETLVEKVMSSATRETH